MAHAYTTKRGKNKKAKLGVRKDHQQNLEKAMKLDPLANLMYDGPRESVLTRGHIGSSSRLENVISRLQKSLLDKCSNPNCTSAASECTNLSECASCHQTRYCGRECQLSHWEEHKTRCKEVRKEIKAREKEKQDTITAALQEMNLLAKPAEETAESGEGKEKNVDNNETEETESAEHSDNEASEEVVSPEDINVID